MLLSCRWTVQLSRPHDLSPSGVTIVERIGRRLADSGQGVLYDPQADAIRWPRNPTRLREPPKRRSSDPARVRLEWLVARRLTAADAHALLATLRGIAPESLPVRFGDFEPMQGQLERDGDGAFAQMWDGGSSLFWNGRFPLDRGHVSLQRGLGSALAPAEREARTPMLGGRKAVAIDAVSLVFHIEVVEDARWLALLTRLFAAVASGLDCFFAAAFCDPGRKSEPVNLLGRYWMGIPTADLWLVWVGSPYRAHLPSPTEVTREMTDARSSRSACRRSHGIACRPTGSNGHPS